MKYPDHKTYRALYARYYKEQGLEEITSLLLPILDTRVLDLCGGDGRLSLAIAAQRSKEVVMIDESLAMIPSELIDRPGIRVCCIRVQEYLRYASAARDTFDRVACQQAVNYWLNEDTAQSVAAVLNPGGVFVFNTFNHKPTEKPRVLEYDREGHSFVEVSWLVDDKVHHLQARDGMEPHHTVFLWLSPERLRGLLEPYFVVHEYRREKTSLYRCEKK